MTARRLSKIAHSEPAVATATGKGIGWRSNSGSLAKLTAIRRAYVTVDSCLTASAAPIARHVIHDKMLGARTRGGQRVVE
jgi:hypothetical protein